MNSKKLETFAAMHADGLDILFLMAAAVLISNTGIGRNDSVSDPAGHPADNVAKIPEKQGTDAVGLAVTG